MAGRPLFASGRPVAFRVTRLHGGEPMLRVRAALAAFSLSLALAGGAAAGDLPGPQSDGSMRLPTGWKLTPVGRYAETGDFPLGLCLSPDGRWAVASCSGEDGAGLSIVDLSARPGEKK